MNTSYRRHVPNNGYTDDQLRVLTREQVERALDSYLEREGQTYDWDKQAARLGQSYLEQYVQRPSVPEERRLRALELIPLGTVLALKPVLKRWLRTSDPKARPTLARHVAAYGSDDLVPEVKKLLADPGTYVAYSVRNGALEAIKEGRAEPKFKAYMWAHEEEYVAHMARLDAGVATALLSAIDPERAKAALSRPEVLRMDHPSVHEVVRALNHLKAPPPAEFLLKALKKLALQKDYWGEKLEEAALVGMMLQDHPKSGEYAEKIIRNTRKPKHERELPLLAWERRFRAHLLPVPYEAPIQAWSSAQPAKFGSFSPEQQKFILLHEFDTAVQSDEDFAAWFWHPLASHTPELLAILKSYGAEKHVKFITSALEILGNTKLLGNRPKLKARMDNFSLKEWVRLSALSHGWWSAPWKLAILSGEWKNAQAAAKSKSGRSGTRSKPPAKAKPLPKQVVLALQQLAKQFRVSLPQSYIEFMSNYPRGLSRSGGELAEPVSDLHIFKSPERIRDFNLEVRDLGDIFADDEVWPAAYFVIGHDGCGNFYALDTKNAKGKIVMFDHEEGDFEDVASDIRNFERYVRDLFELPPAKG